ncbi:MAG: serine/threonine-protein kinase [Acidobacteriota bacterium]
MPEPPESGALIGPYRLMSQLGKGAMGEVWRARDERLDRYVALKVLPPDVAGDPERRARMLREARAAAAIRHASVVTLFDVVEHAGQDILVMELVEGTTLSEHLRKHGPAPLATTLRWLEDIAAALAAAHARRILHRDIKAANIMVTPEGGVKVLDFGLAKLRDDVTPPADATKPSSSTSFTKLALDATMSASDGYQTHAGSLLGTPLYMAPEQLTGDPPDERSEVFSVGVLAYELLAGKPPYHAGSLDELFRQIANVPAPHLDDAPDAVDAIVQRALAKDPAARFQTMEELRAALADARRPRTWRWPLVAAAAFALAAIGGGAWWYTHRTPPPRPGDDYVARALEEYDVFYNDKALSSLRAALAVAPEHPRANAYMILFGGASDADRATALAAAHRAERDAAGKDRALLAAAIASVEQGTSAARAALGDSGGDRELAFWAAELDWRSSHYQAAHDEYRALLAEPAPQFRGRIYDHYSSVLLYFDEPAEALRIGKLYRDAFPGEADAVGVYATTLAAAGKLDEALAAAEDALRLAEGEDTLAGLAKVLAIEGDHARAKELYQRSLDRAGPARRPLRRAALALLQWLDGDADAARATVAPCLPGGAEAQIAQRGACLFVAGVVDPSRLAEAASELDALARDASDLHPAYGAPASLAALLRARDHFFAGACITAGDRDGDADEAAYSTPLDFFAAYHVPFFATWALCERAALLAKHGDRAAAAALLRPVATRAPNRTWLLQALARYQ